MKKLLIIVSGLITLMLTAVLIAAFYILNINPNDHKEWIAEKFTEQTGRQLILDGELGLTIYPWFGLELNQVTISNAPGFGTEPMLYTEQAQVRIKLLPLLDEQYEIDTVRLLGSRINLAINQGGQSNWDDFIDSTATEDSEVEDSGQGSPINLNNIALGGVDIQNASINFDDDSTDQHFQLSNINVSIGELQYGDPIQANFNLNAVADTPQLGMQSQLSGIASYDLEAQLYNLSPLSLTGTITGPDVPGGSTPINLTATLSANLNDKTFSLPSLEFDALGIHLSANLTGSDKAVDGKLSLSSDTLNEALLALGQADLAESARSFNLDVQASGSPEKLALSPLTLNLVLDGPKIPNSPTSVNLTADSEINLDGETLEMEAFTLKGLGLNVDGSLRASKILSQPDIKGEFTIASFNLRTLLGQLNQPVPATVDNTTLQRLALKSEFDFSTDNSTLALDELVLTLDETTMNAELEVEDFEKPEIEFSISLDQFNADRYLPPPTTDSNSSSAEPSDLPTDMLNQLSAKGDISIQSLQINNLKLDDFLLAFEAANNQLKVSPLRMNLYQGSYNGSLSLDARTETPQINIDANMENVELEPLMMDFMDSSYISGTGNIKFSLSGSGTTLPALKSSLNGGGNVEVLDGIFSGVDVGSVLAQVETMIRSEKLMEIKTGQQTAFNSFTGTIAINNGRVRSDDLLIVSPGFQVAGRGTLINLNNDTIQYDLTTSVDPSTATRNSEEYDIGGYSLPIACSGSIDSPRCLPDTEEIIKQALGRAITRGLGDFLQEALGGGDENTETDANNAVEEEDPGRVLLNRALESLFK